jgi:hypothetical protein
VWREAAGYFPPKVGETRGRWEGTWDFCPRLGIPNFGSNVSSQRGLLYRVEKEMGQIDRLLEATSPTPYTNVPFVRIMRLRCIMILL